LSHAGFTPINNIVDITNYIMLKYGQPMHAFDLAAVGGKKVFVRLSKIGEECKALDGNTYALEAPVLVIADAARPIAIAGVIGGEESKVKTETRSIWLEAASFEPKAVRKSAKMLHLRTEASARFEKGVDANGIDPALQEAVHLLQTIASGQAATGRVDLKQTMAKPRITVRLAKVNQLLGTELSFSEVISLLQRLEFTISTLNDTSFMAIPPSYRFDVQMEVDVIEEIGRLYGYQHIPIRKPYFTFSTVRHDPMYEFETKVRKQLVSLGLQECITPDLISPKLALMAQEMLLGETSLLKTLHAKSEEFSILRPTLLPGLVDVAEKNIAQNNRSLHLFEIGRIHFKHKETTVEKTTAAILMAGSSRPAHWSQKTANVNFYDILGIVEALFESLHASSLSLASSNHTSFHPYRQVNITHDQEIIGSCGQIHPMLVRGIDMELYYAEIDLTALLPLVPARITMQKLPTFPSSERDWTLALPLNVPMAKICSAIAAANEPLLEHYSLIDLYTPPQSQKAPQATIRFTYRDKDKTVLHEEVEDAHKRVVETVVKILSTV
jgi:phenylalanyl-tRNA synthetase beta chain